MDFKYLRFMIFGSLMRPFSVRSRHQRMQEYLKCMQFAAGTSVLDLGGQPMIWNSVQPRLHITILNLPGVAESKFISHHSIDYVEGDACKVSAFTDQQFDTVFSNSVIEHVGPPEKQEEFAREVRRLGRSYWVQTPSKWFPIEAHCGMPLWWFYPASLRRFCIERWRSKLPAWTEMVEGTRVLAKADLQRLFPEATIRTERVLGVPKSYTACFTGR